jgi:thioester reductase-like protein
VTYWPTKSGRWAAALEGSLHTQDIHGGVWQGYAQSKWICEQIVSRFAGADENFAGHVVPERFSQYRGFVHRFGSLANDADMVAVLSASVVVGALPSEVATVDWLDIKMLCAELVSCVADDLVSAQARFGEAVSLPDCESVRHYSCRCEARSICRKLQPSETPELQSMSTAEWCAKIEQAFLAPLADPQHEQEDERLHLKQEVLKHKASLASLGESVVARVQTLIGVRSGLKGAIGLCERPI